MLTAGCHRDHSLYEPLFDVFEYQSAADTIGRSSVTVVRDPTSGDGRMMTVSEFLDYRDASSPLEKVEPRLRAFALAERLADIPYPNLTPVYLRDRVTPLFFETFPDGRIWYVARNDATWGAFLKRQLRFAEKHRPDARLSPPDGREVQPFSGLPPDALPYYAVVWLATTLFPHVLFAVAPVIGGFFLLFPSPIPQYDGWGDTTTLRTVTEGQLAHVYGDRREPTSAARSVVPEAELDGNAVNQYTEWWVQAVSRTWGRLVECRNDRTLMLAGLTLNRMLVEATLINTSFTHFQRKVGFFQVLDKAAALVAAARGKVGQRSEVEIWQELVSRTFIRARLAPFIARIPGCGRLLEMLTSGLLDSLQFDKLRPRVLRAYRNSAHGYNIRQAATLLRHGEPIDNDLPDLATAIVLYLVGSRVLDGLKKVELP